MLQEASPQEEVDEQDGGDQVLFWLTGIYIVHSDYSPPPLF